MKNTILVIEDSSEVRKDITEILELADYAVLQAAEGKSGLELARKYHPDLILCDIGMPVLDGFGVLHAIENNPDLVSTPFVFLTAEPVKNNFRKAMNMGADDYLTKPFSGDELLMVVNTRLKRNQILKNAFSKNLERLKDFVDEIKTLNNSDFLAANQTIRKFKKKEFIFHEGDKAENLYFVLSGKVKTFKTNYWGKEYITDIYKEEDFFGYIPLLDGNEQQESAMAIDNSQIVLISKLDFYGMLHSNNDVSDSFTKMLAHSLSLSGDKLLNLAYDSAIKKVAEALVFISKKYESSDEKEYNFPAHREDISAIAGLSPESVSRNLSELKTEGLIEIENGNIKIQDIRKLENLKW